MVSPDSNRAAGVFSLILERLCSGLTESSGAVSVTLPEDVLPGSSGILIPGFEARLIRPDGSEVEGYNDPGELHLKSPCIVAGYLGDADDNAAVFQDGWLHTGMFKDPKATTSCKMAHDSPNIKTVC